MISSSPTLILYIVLFLTGLGLDLVLTRMNLSHLRSHGHKVPDVIKGYVDHARLCKITDYTVENQRFDLFVGLISSVSFLIVLLSGLLPWFVGIVKGMKLGVLLSGLIFFAALALVQTLFSLPFSYYQTFVIEQQHGFNTSTLRIWITDMLKSLVLGTVIGGILLVAVLLLMEYGGDLWWFWAWCFFFAFQILLLFLYPRVIAPWFNKFLPLEDQVLKAKVTSVIRKGGLSVEGVLKMDAGKRSRHTNAYFTGLGKTKRIVLFDTLLSSNSHDEILAILAHEIGHWKKRHVLKSILLVGSFSLVVLSVASIFLKWPGLYEAFGFKTQDSYVGLFLFGIFWGAVSQFLGPVGNAISRRHEREADAYAVELLQEAADLKNALKGMARDNLSNLHPHPLYAWFHYSHPPIIERIEYLGKLVTGH